MAYNVGDILTHEYDRTNRLPCDGRVVDAAMYPDLAAVMSGVTVGGAETIPAGYFYLPTISPQVGNIVVLIQAK